MYTTITEFTVSSMLAVPSPGRPRQMTLAEGPPGGQQQQQQQLQQAQLRGWDNGIGGYQTNTMLETRIGATTNGGHEGN